jgi:hypothetical protein
MIMPKRIQRRRKKGWKKPPNTINISRPGKWGNPFVIGVHGTRKEVIDKFTKEIAYKHVVEIRNELKGKDLMCWCPLDQLCHGDILLKIANGDQ